MVNDLDRYHGVAWKRYLKSMRFPVATDQSRAAYAAGLEDGWKEALEEAAGYHDKQATGADDKARDIMRREGDDPVFRAKAQRWHQYAEEQRAAAARIRALAGSR